MNDVVERVARAIGQAWLSDGDSPNWLPPIEFTDAELEHLARAAIEAMPLRRLLQSAKLLYANAVGCAQSHYGDDFSEHGMPGWLVDCQRDIDALSAALADASPDIGKEGIGNDVR